MSETVKYVGTIREVSHGANETIEEIAQRLLGEERESGYDSWLEQLQDKRYDEFVVRNGVLYEINATQDDDDSDIFEMTKEQNGDLRFVVQFYNGGCSLDEAIGYAFDNLEKRNG